MFGPQEVPVNLEGIMRKSHGFAMIQVMIVIVFAATFVYVSMLSEANKNAKSYHEEAIVTLFPAAYSFVEYAINQIPDTTSFSSDTYYTEDNLNSDYSTTATNLGFDPDDMNVDYADDTNEMTFTWTDIDGKSPQRVTIIAKGLASKLSTKLSEDGYTFDATTVTKNSDTYTITITFIKTT